LSAALRKTREAYDGLAETYDRVNRSIEDIVGLDLSSELLRIARRKAREACLILADMRRPPFRDRCFDGA